MTSTTNKTKLKIAIFGDSNSWASIEHDGKYGKAYPALIQSDHTQVINDAVPGRSTIFDVKTGTRGQSLNGDKQTRNGLTGLISFTTKLREERIKINRFVLALGINDLMNPSLNQNVLDVKNNLKLLIDQIWVQNDIFTNSEVKIFLLTSFLVSEEKYPEISQKLKQLEFSLKKLSNVELITINGIVPGKDGVHFPQSEHTIIAHQLIQKLSQNL